MAKERPSGLDRVPYPVTNPELIPAQRYYDPEFFALENEKLWPHVWQMACRLEEIPDVGDYVDYRILDKSVIVVRTRTGVKAFHNACRHRGMQLVTGPGNCARQGFSCRFHGWRYDMDGECTFVFGKQIFSEELLEKTQISLRPCRVELSAGCAFINFDDRAPALLESLGPVVERLNARNVDKLKMDWWYATKLPANWKLAMEAFMESYHVMRTHPQLAASAVTAGTYGADSTGQIPNRALDARQTVNAAIKGMAELSAGMAGLIHSTEVAVIEKLGDMPLPDEPGEAVGALFMRSMEEITKDGLARGAPMFDVAKVSAEHPSKGVEFMFPNFFLLPCLSAMSSYRIRPLTPESCLFEIWSLVLRPENEQFETPKRPTLLPYDSKEFPEIPQQDYANLPLQQLGLHASGFEFMRLSRSVEGMISNYQRLIDGYLADLGPQSLIKAAQVVNGGYDAPILDIGF
jgi:nitrite reductase/ring-hydroxylating ferredoxin subunit